MSEMIERVAEALNQASRHSHGQLNAELLQKLARASIEAVRDYLCSDEAYDALGDAWADVEEYADHPTELSLNPRRLKAMIDEALK